MNIRKLTSGVNDRSLNRQERTFRILALLGLIGLLLGILVGVLNGEAPGNLLAMGGAFFVLLIIVMVSIRFRNTQNGAVLISFLIILLVLPYNFITSGGIDGGGPIWFLFGAVFVCLVVEKRIKFVLMALDFIVIAVCYYIAYAHPDMILAHTEELAYIDSFGVLYIVTLLICAMILFQNTIFQSENALALQQKKEIEELNEAQNRFFSNMSHEIRTPINTIIGLNEMILREAVSEEVAADAQNIRNASKMLLTIINDILDMSKIESGRMEVVSAVYDTGAMLSDIVNMIWVRAGEKGLAFHIDVDKKLPAQLCGDEVRIKQILINVLNNAVKYTNEGSVTLSIRCQGIEDGQAEIVYSVSDTGIGIKKENIPYLFNAFKRVDEEQNRYVEGTGLGLAIVKQLVELMGGSIAVNSIYKRGSTFVITIPQKVADGTQIGELDLAAHHEVHAKERYKQSFEAPEARILIVDDDEMNLMVAEKLLKATRVQIDTVRSGAGCLEMTLVKRYHVIFMDHLMPEMDGITCLHEIRRQSGGLNQETPVVALTANAGSDSRELYRGEGFDGYLVKPVSGASLEAELLRNLPEELVQMRRTGEISELLEAPVLEHREKRTVMITTDSTCDLPHWMLEKYRIAAIPHLVATEGGEFMDGVETETDGILAYVGERGKQAKSLTPSVESYEEFFAEQLTKAQSVIHISIAEHASGGYPHSLEASGIFDNVTVVDSGQLSCGQGLLVLRAAECVMAGMSVDAVLKEIARMKPLICTTFIVKDTEYLARSGRLSPNVNQICRKMMIHPVLVMKKSRIAVKKLLLGTAEAAFDQYIASAFRVSGELDRRILFIAYAGFSREELKEIEEKVRAREVFETVIFQKVCPTIAMNCGAGTFGLVFMQK